MSIKLLVRTKKPLLITYHEIIISGDKAPRPSCKVTLLRFFLFILFFYLCEFQPMMPTPDNSSLSSDQNINWFLM